MMLKMSRQALVGPKKKYIKNNLFNDQQDHITKIKTRLTSVIEHHTLKCLDNLNIRKTRTSRTILNTVNVDENPDTLLSFF